MLAAVLTAAALLAACGPATAPASSTSVPPPPEPDPLVSAVTMTRSWGSARVEVDQRADIAGSTVRSSASGEITLDKPWGRLVWSWQGSPREEIVNDVAVFTRDGAGGWQRTELATGTPTSAAVDPLRLLDGTVEPLGAVDLDGQQVQAYRVSLPLTTDAVRAFALTDAQRAAVLGAAGAGAVVTATAWVDANHRIVRVDRHLEVPGATADTSTRMLEFGMLLDLASPPSASVSARP